jgi:hypothetical protein
MVKNTGGNKSKKVARKNVTSITTMHDVRRSMDSNEMYASVTKIYSSQRCGVIGSDGNTYQCNIRGKFLKNKRSNDGLGIGCWVLIGFYDWEVRSNGIKNCDLLEIYSSVEKDKLKQLEPLKLSYLLKNDGGNDLSFSDFHKDDKARDPEPAEPSLIIPSLRSLLDVKSKKSGDEEMNWLEINEGDI